MILETLPQIARLSPVQKLTLAGVPSIGPVYTGRFRRLVLSGTPFGLFYCLEPRRLVISALLDLRQSPEAIRSRLGRATP